MVCGIILIEILETKTYYWYLNKNNMKNKFHIIIFSPDMLKKFQ